MAKKRGKDAQQPKNTPQEPLSEEQRAALIQYYEKLRAGPPRVKKHVGKSGAVSLIFEEHPLMGPKLAEAFGSANRDFQQHMIDHILGTFPAVLVARRDDATESDHDAMAQAGNTAMAIIGAAKPRNELEAMLVVQMIGAHNIAMTLMRRALSIHQDRESVRFYTEMANKMLRTYSSQLETLKRYREGGQQKVVVEHVHVNQGGKAIVGTVQGTTRNEQQSSD